MAGQDSRFNRSRGLRQGLVSALVGGGLGLVAVAGPATATTAHAYPVTVTAGNGKVTIKHQPTRIVSLSPTATDMLFAVGAGKQVVAVDADSTFPTTAPKTSLSGLTPNVEAIEKYRPDLVVVSYDANNIVKSLQKLGTKVLVEPAAKSLADSYAQLGALGTATGHASGANKVVHSMRQQISSAVKKAPKQAAGHSYYYELDQTFYSATSSTFIGQVLGMFGLKDIANTAKGASGGYPQLSEEFVVKANPSVIFLADTVCCHQSPTTVKARPGWSQLNAVRSGAIVPLNDSIASQWGPHVVTLVDDVEQALARIYGKSAG